MTMENSNFGGGLPITNMGRGILGFPEARSTWLSYIKRTAPRSKTFAA
jgi:hypothetical protein